MIEAVEMLLNIQQTKGFITIAAADIDCVNRAKVRLGRYMAVAAENMTDVGIAQQKLSQTH